MGHKIKIKYWARENSKVGTHSFFAQTMPNGTLGFDQACREASENTTVEEDTIRSAVKLYMKVVKKNLLKGFKVDLGEDFLTIEPMLKASVKDTKDEKTGEVTVATAKMLRSNMGNSRVGVRVNKAFAFEFANSVEWEKVDPKTGAIIDESDDVVEDPNDPADTGNTGSTGNIDQTGGNTGGGSDEG